MSDDSSMLAGLLGGIIWALTLTGLLLLWRLPAHRDIKALKAETRRREARLHGGTEHDP